MRFCLHSPTWSGTTQATHQKHALLNVKSLVLTLRAWSMVQSAVSILLKEAYSGANEDHPSLR